MTPWLALALVLLPCAAEACATCIGSPYGDRTYSWPYLLLIALPFAVAAVVGGVLVHANGGLRALSLRRLRRRVHPSVPHEETTWPR